MTPTLPPRRKQRGLTLIELMISVTIGLLILSALLVVYLGSRNAYRSSDSLARVQETGRFALEFIAQDARMSGFAGCRARNLSVAEGSLTNVTLPAIAFNGAGDGVTGFENGVGWINPTLATATPIARVAGTDVVSIRRAGGMAVGVTANADTVARTVTVRHNGIGLANGDIAVLGNCEGALVFRVTNNPVLTGIGNFPTTLEFKATGAGAAGLEGNNILIPLPPIFTLGSRAEVLRFVETSYFIGQNAAGRPGLFRVAAGAIEELVEDVEDMDVVYGVDNTLPDIDGIVDVYRRADAITDWGRVVSMRISLLVVGPENNVTTGAQTYAFRDTDGDGLPDTQTAPDRRLRHVFTTTISLRNRVM